MTAAVAPQLDELLERYVARYREVRGTLPRQAFDPEWPSPCQLGPPDADGLIEWRPVRRDGAPADFTGLENALEQALHPALKTFFGRYWSDVVEGRTEEGGLTLVQVWNPRDFERLLENIIGHAFAKLRDRRPLTVFFATTDEEEYFLSVDNASGRVMLESPGLPPVREMGASLGEFLARVEPVVPSGGEP